MNPGGRPRTGGLFRRRGQPQWYARFTVDKDGVPVSVVRALGTDSKQVAKAKLARLVSEALPPEEASRGELFQEAAQRVTDAQVAAGSKSWTENLARLKEHVFPALGPMAVETIKARHITDMLEGVRITDRRTRNEVMPARATLKRLLANVSTILDDLWRKEQLSENVAKRVRLPKADQQTKERAVLTDFELARYLKWQHPQEDHQVAVLERQTMSCIARLFGGVRTGDLHAMTWDSLDATNGRFAVGFAPRSKTKKPQRLIIDDMLRPIIRRWWEANKKPLDGFVFPSLRDGKHSRAGKGEKHNVSHAGAMRQDLRRAFGIDKLEPIVTKQKNGRKMPGYKWEPCRELTPRETELLLGNARTLPVDFHSWRRAYCQALADGGVNAQLAKALAGHSTEAAHERYLRSSEKARVLPEAARPHIDLGNVSQKAARVSVTNGSKT
jgi:integrase